MVASGGRSTEHDTVRHSHRLNIEEANEKPWDYRRNISNVIKLPRHRVDTPY